jgi:DNA ligase-1
MKLLFITTTLNKSVRYWTIERDSTQTTVRYGSLGSFAFVEETISENETAYRKRIKDKIKSGYVGVDKLPDKIEWAYRVVKEANDKLPFKNPMKCQKYDPRKFKYPCIGQPKLNGLRCYIIWGEWVEGDGFFKERKEGVMLLSSEGNRYIVPHVANWFKKEDFCSNGDGIPDIYYDGELYVHGEKLNTIKSRIPIEINGIVSKPALPVYLVNFFCFDIAIEDSPFRERLKLQHDKLKNRVTTTLDISPNGSISGPPVVLVESKVMLSAEDAMTYTEQCIARGFEGCVLREFENLYEYGKRPSTIIKIKKFIDSEFEVVDIIQVKDGQYGCLFICRNDINSATFECNPTGKYEKQNQHYANREKIIGKPVTVRYYERSGVKKCPFHANVITVRDYE